MTLSQLAALPYKWILAQKTIQRREHASALANLTEIQYSQASACPGRQRAWTLNED